VTLDAPVARGDGLLVEGGFNGEGEVGGRVWTLRRRGEDVESARAGETVSVWFGPDRSVDAARAGRRVWKTSDPAREKEVRTAIERDVHRVGVRVTVKGEVGARPVFEAATERGGHATVEGDAVVERAQARPTTREVLEDKLGRLGDTAFRLDAVVSEVAGEGMIPLSSLNRARRALVEALGEDARRRHPLTGVTHESLLAKALPPTDRAPPAGGLFVLCRTLEQAHAAVDAGAEGVYLDFLELTGTGAAVRALRARGGVHITLAPPRIRKPGEEKIDRYLASLGADAVLVRGLGALRERAAEAVTRIGDFSLNVTNRITASEVLARGLAAFTPSFDLDATQLVSLLDSPFAPWAEVVVHHPMPLFHMEHCVIAALLSNGGDHRTCGRPCESHKVSLRDRARMEHPVEADVGCRNTVFHARSQSAAGVIERCRELGVRRFRIELVREGAKDVGAVVEVYRALLEGRLNALDARRRLRAEGGYGVVTGSLRVVP